MTAEAEPKVEEEKTDKKAESEETSKADGTPTAKRGRPKKPAAAEAEQPSSPKNKKSKADEARVEEKKEEPSSPKSKKSKADEARVEEKKEEPTGSEAKAEKAEEAAGKEEKGDAAGEAGLSVDPTVATPKAEGEAPAANGEEQPKEDKESEEEAKKKAEEEAARELAEKQEAERLAKIEEMREKEEDEEEDSSEREYEGGVAMSDDDSTLNTLRSPHNHISPMNLDGMQLVASCRANTGIVSGRYMVEAEILSLNNPIEMRIGFSTEKASLFLGDEGSIGFTGTQMAFTHAQAKPFPSARRFSRGDVVGVLLNRSEKGNANTLSLFLNGQRQGQPQPLPEEFKDLPLFFHVSVKAASVWVNLSDGLCKTYPFKVRTLGQALDKDVVEAEDKSADPELIVPVGFFSKAWLTEFAQERPDENFVEITQSFLHTWQQKSSLTGQPLPHDVLQFIEKIMRMKRRKFVYSFGHNLLRRDRENLCARFPEGLKKVAVVHDEVFKDLPTHNNSFYKDVCLPTEEEGFDDVLFATSEEKSLELLKAWQAKTRDHSRVEGLVPGPWFKERIEEWKKFMEATKKEGAETKREREAKEEVAKKEAEVKKEPEAEAEKMDTGDEAKAAAEGEKPVVEAEVKEEVKEEDGEKKTETASSDAKPKTEDGAVAAPASTTASADAEANAQDADHKAGADTAAATDAPQDAAPVPKTTAQDEATGDAKKEVEEGKPEEADVKKEEKEEPGKEEKPKEIKEVEIEPIVRKEEREGVSCIDTSCWSEEDWLLAELRVESHLLCHAFRKDMTEEGHTQFSHDNFIHYYRLYNFPRSFYVRNFGVNTLAELCEPIKDTVEVVDEMVTAKRPEDAKYDDMIEQTEVARRVREALMGAGDESAKLKFSAADRKGGYKGNNYKGQNYKGGKGPFHGNKGLDFRSKQEGGKDRAQFPPQPQQGGYQQRSLVPPQNQFQNRFPIGKGPPQQQQQPFTPTSKGQWAGKGPSNSVPMQGTPKAMPPKRPLDQNPFPTTPKRFHTEGN